MFFTNLEDIAMQMRTIPLSPFEELFWEEVDALGVKGLLNGHAHADRGNTLNQEFLKHIHRDPADASKISLMAKQKMVGKLHEGPAYTFDNLKTRMIEFCEQQIAYRTAELWTCIDVSPDLRNGGKTDGLMAFRAAKEVKEEFTGRLDVKIGPNAIFGFKEGTERWPLFKQAAEQADFLSALPEKDLYPEGTDSDGKIGFDQHIRRVLELAIEMNKPVQFHLDQSGNPNEGGTERLIEALKWFDPLRKGPEVSIVHFISPSAKTESEYAKILYDLRKYRVKIVGCPAAGVSMRCPRPLMTPSHNSFARVLELLAYGIPVALGSDNVCDLFVPSCSGDMMVEVIIASHAVRFYLAHIWAKVAAGVSLNDTDKDSVKESLRQDVQAFRGIDPLWKPAVNVDIE